MRFLLLSFFILVLHITNINTYAFDNKTADTSTINNINIDSRAQINLEEIYNKVKPFIGLAINANNLQQLLDTISAAYQDYGYNSAKAVLPVGKIENGLINVLVLTPNIQDLNIVADDELFSSFSKQIINANIKTLQGHAISQKQIESKLLSLSDLGIFDIEGDIKATSEISEYKFDVYLTQKNNFEFATFANNHGSKTSGVYRVGFYGSFKNLSSNLDKLSFYLAKTDKKQNNIYLDYNLPINEYLTLVGANINASNYELTGTYAKLGAKGYGIDYNLYIKQNIKRNLNFKSDFEIALNYKELKDSFETFNINFNKNYKGLYTNLSNYYQYNNHLFLTNSKLSFGKITHTGFEFFDDQNFYIFNQEINYKYKLNLNLEFENSLKLQLSSAPLDGSFMQSISGADAIAAYDAALIAGDNTLVNLSYLNIFLPFVYDFKISPHLDLGLAKNKHQNAYHIYAMGLDSLIKVDNFFSKLQFNYALKTLEDVHTDKFNFYFSIGYQYY